MKIQVTLSAEKYHKGRDEFTALREKPRCQLQCPQHKPAKSRCKKCEYSQHFAFRGSLPGYDFVWENPSHEKFKASYKRDLATDTLVEVRIEYESAVDEDVDASSAPSAVYHEFTQWVKALGAGLESTAAKRSEPLRQEIVEQLQLFDNITTNKLKAMQKTSPLRPAATEEYIQAFLLDRQKKRKELERELERNFGLG